MFGSSSSSAKADNSPVAPSDSSITHRDKTDSKSPSPEKDASPSASGSNGDSIGVKVSALVKSSDQAASGEKRSGNGSPPANSTGGASGDQQKKRRSSGVGGRSNNDNNSAAGADAKSSPAANQTPLQKLGKQDQALAVPQGQHNNAAGESLPGPRSTFSVGVWEDRNKKCRRTMEDTHAFLYNFLCTPAPALKSEASSTTSLRPGDESDAPNGDKGALDMTETDNGYFAVFDGHAGTFAADWCGKKLHIILEEIIRKNPNSPIPELLDQTFTTVDHQLEKLPLRNSGCTAAVAVLRWEDRVPSNQSATGSQAIAPAVAKATEEASKTSDDHKVPEKASNAEAAHARLKGAATRQRVLYTANVGDARIILCRAGKALRLSYDHKGSDENEGKRIANAGGLILNNRVNGVLAVTRALGDTYMKELITGHPYTTETVIQPEIDEFIIIACDGLWDVCQDQEAVDLVRDTPIPAAAAKLLVDHALASFSTDNLSCMIVRLDKQALIDNRHRDNPIGVEGDSASSRFSEADKIVTATKQKIAEGGTPAVGVSASNSGRGHEPRPIDGGGEQVSSFTPTMIEGSVEEEPASIDDDVVVDTSAGSAVSPKPS